MEVVHELIPNCSTHTSTKKIDMPFKFVYCHLTIKWKFIQLYNNNYRDLIKCPY